MDTFPVQDGQTFLCIGDSITDAGRCGEAAPLGNGYVSLFADMVTAQYPKRRIRFINKGLSGNRIPDLRMRWADDVVRHNPDWLSILVGINDLHAHLIGADTGVSPDQYRADMEWLLTQTAQRTKAQVVLLAPFYISGDHGTDTLRSQDLALIPQYIEIVREAGQKHGTRFVDTHQLFQDHLAFRESETFCPEPVHPNRTGHLVIAMALMQALTA